MPDTKHAAILFIINPNSGSGKNKSIIHKFSKQYPGIDFKESSSVDSFRTICQENIDHYKYFILAGGDGTINAAVNFFYHYPDKVLGIYPSGSGNGFAKEMGFTRNINQLLTAVKENKTQTVDVIDLNGIKCINVAGVGLDSYIAHRFSTSTTRGLFTYVRLTLKSVLRFKPFKVRISIGEKEITGEYLIISIANTRQFGNNAFIAPKANPCDGKFDVVLVKRLPVFSYPVFAIRMFMGTLRNTKYLNYITVSEPLIIDCELNEFHIDGDPRTFSGPVTVTIEKNKLQILAV